MASRAQREAAARGLSGMMDGTKTGFTIQGQQEERYHCAVAYLGCPQPLCLVMLQADAPQRMHLMKTGAVYCLIALLGEMCIRDRPSAASIARCPNVKRDAPFIPPFRK